MSRFISLLVLLAFIVIVGALFYKVMIGFFVPLFLAAVLVVVFRPLHRKVLAMCRDREHIAAGITTTLIIFSVLLPTALILSMSAIQGTALLSNITPNSISVFLNNTRKQFGLESPCQPIIRTIQDEIDTIQSVVGSSSLDQLRDSRGELASLDKRLRTKLDSLIPTMESYLATDVKTDLRRARDSSSDPSSFDSASVERELELAANLELRRYEENWKPAIEEVRKSLNRLTRSIAVQIVANRTSDRSKSDSSALDEDDEKNDQEQDPDESSESKVDDPLIQQLIDEILPSEGSSFDSSDPLPALLEDEDEIDIIEIRARAFQLSLVWQDARSTLLGGGFLAYLREIANPSEKQINDTVTRAIEYIQPQLILVTGATAEFLIRILIGCAILVLALYFFLYDGPGMIRTFMKLSPLDDRYELELLIEFDRIARAIVLAMILSAVAQGVTAGIGFYFAGVSSLILLVLLSFLCGLIPFVGPGLVWVPVCIHLAAYENQYWTAGFLALWGFLVVGSIDNVVKAYVLHGQSQLHPLLALLSVLGGVQALGPIGLVVGPIIVVLLQTLLGILQRELTEFDSPHSRWSLLNTSENDVDHPNLDNSEEAKTLREWVRSWRSEPTEPAATKQASVAVSNPNPDATVTIPAPDSTKPETSSSAEKAPPPSSENN